MLKSLSEHLIRYGSSVFPAGFLFRVCLLLRRLRHKAAGAGLPEFFCKALDHLMINLRPAKVPARVRWGGEEGQLYVLLNDPPHYDFVLGIYEPAIVDWLCRNLKPGMTMLDIGANVGYYTVLAARLVGKQGRILAVEGDPEVAEIAKRNLLLNGLENVQVVSGVATTACGVAKFGRSSVSGWGGLHYDRATEWIEVPAYTVDSLASRLGLARVDVVKIDAEGAEAEVLAGMGQLIRSQQPLLLVEIHAPDQSGQNPALLTLQKNGYVIQPLDEPAGTAHVLAVPGKNLDEIPRMALSADPGFVQGTHR
jgi:FkbM family methyltransferase